MEKAMINPTSEWMYKHGFHHWGVRLEVGFYVYTLDAWDVAGERVKHVEVNIDRRVYDRLQTNKERRTMLYNAILEEASESGNGIDVDSGSDSALPESGGAVGAGGEGQ